MKAKSMVLILIALGCGLVASIGISQVMDRGSQQGGVVETETQRILVALTNIDIGEKLNAQNVKLEEWPKDRIPEGALTDLEEIKENFPRTRMYAGEPIMKAKLMDKMGGAVPIIPEGYRVVPVKVAPETVTGLILPGDRVDVLVFLRRGGEVQRTTTRTVLRDVRVFDVDGQTERIVDREGQQVSLKTVSVLVKPSQVETLMLAGELGKIRLSLRRPNDTVEEITDGATIANIFGKEGEVADDRDEKPSSGGIASASAAQEKDASFLAWVNSQQKAGGSLPEAPQRAPEKTAWKMVLQTRDGATEYQWQDPTQLPQTVTPGGSTAVPAPATPANTAPATEKAPAPQGASDTDGDPSTPSDEDEA
jgi:pilus assembly protein CpaB